MIICLSKYFYIGAIKTVSGGGNITGLPGYFTDRSHTMFLPTQKITSQDAINMIGEEIMLFTDTKTGRQKLLKKVEIFGKINNAIE